MKKLVLVSITLVLLAALAACSQPAPSASPAAPKPATTTAAPAPVTPSPTPAATKPAATTTAAPAVKPIVLKFAHFDGMAASHIRVAFDPTFNEIEKASNGRVKIERYYGGSLLKDKELFEGVLNGVADFSKLAMGYQPGLFQLITVGMLPYAAKEPRNVAKAINYLVQEKKYMDKELEGLHYFTSCITTPYDFMYKDKKPMTLAELKGLKMRNPGGYMMNVIQAVGMAPVSLSPSEVYDGFSKGLVEGVYWMDASLLSYKLNEIGKYVQKVGSQIHTANFAVMNDKTWKSLPPDIQGIFNTYMTDKLLDLHAYAWESTDGPAVDDMKKQGIEFYSWPQAEVDKMRTAILPAYSAAIADLDKKGLNGKQVMTDFVNFLKSKGENPPWTP